MSVDYPKLKTNLNLIMHRLKLVEKKKMELNQKARRTIGEFLNAGKVDRARIRVEQIIREDYVVEAMDLVESYCDFLLSRFGQLKATETVDEGLATAISSLIWVTPYFDADVPELKTISDQLGRKYGKQYITAVRENQLKTVNETLMKKLSVQVPPKVLVEKYLVEIAKDQKIDYKPDPRIMKEQEALSSTGFGPGASSDEDDDSRRQRQRQSGEQPPPNGFNLIDLGDHYPRSPMTQPNFNPYGQPPPLPSEPPTGGTSAVPTELDSDTIDASAPTVHLPIGFNLPSLDDSSSSGRSQVSSKEKNSATTNKPLHQEQSSSSGGENANSSADGGPPPNYDSVVNKTTNQTQYYSFGPDSTFSNQHQSQNDHDDTLPELPPVPIDTKNNNAASSSAARDEALDFEDLTKRFEELKNKKN